MLDQLYANVTPGPPKPSKLYIPSQFTLPPGTERYVVEGMGAALIPVSAGDQITLTNDEGAQVCEIVAAGAGGRILPGILDAPANTQATGLMSLLSSSDQSLRGLRMGLEARGIDVHDAAAVRLFGDGAAAGETETIRVSSDGCVIIAAPGVAMDAELQNTTTPITVMMKRAIIKKHVGFELPDPLADPVDDIRVHSATAEAYFVKAGDYIQILDVDGRQCTDFECFSARKLDKGIEHA